MGVTDEHWCSDCGKKLDKRKEKYLEVDWINYHKWKKKQKKTDSVIYEKKIPQDKALHDRAYICQDCLNKYPFIKRVFGKLRMVGNPNFNVIVECKSWSKCKNFEKRNKNVNCKHISVINDKLYCKRRHPKFIILPQEKSKISREKLRFIAEYLGEFMKKTGFKGGVKDLEKILAQPKINVSLDDLKFQPLPEIIVKTGHPYLEKKRECEII